ncbi:hypothetical protein [Brevibacterium sp. UCMA 11752]|uniref:hypothetical protein n=1 Tax=Brevibacterium sp. UCMA 11752 TaxID=2745946 RepID=UPI001F2ADD55|nr:hypothetical protein [Brevibacterium sp. UCMA 11752]MCF2588029.1 hypothetical protein [Brevibacterium sp. UCMA 11752]
MSRAQLLASNNALQLGSATIPGWALWVLALAVVLLIVGIVFFVLARRARKIARATDASKKGGEDFGGHGFGYFGAVTSAISITPDVKRRTRGDSGSKSDD